MKGKSAEENTNELEKLINEKNSLLKSGMYNENDALIQRLDAKIKILIEQN
jgi:hypothetical protein